MLNAHITDFVVSMQALGLYHSATSQADSWSLPSGLSRSPEVSLPEADEPLTPQEPQQWQHEQLTLDQAGQDQSGYMDDADQPLDLLSSDQQMPATEASRGTLSFLGGKEIDLKFDSVNVSATAAPSSSRPSYHVSSANTHDQNVQQALDNLPAIMRQRATEPVSQGLAAGQKRVQNTPVIELGLENEAVQRAAANIKLDPRITESQREGYADIYTKAAAERVGAVSGPSAPLTVQPPADKHKKWSYQLLLESDALMRFTRLVINEFRGYFKAFHEHTLQRQELEWVIMVDNSGSMGSKKTQTAEALVLAIETLRRLECRFSVWRFGNKGASGHVVLKTFEEPFTYATGQKILEGFTYNEGTHPGTNLKAIAHETWGSAAQVHAPDARKHRMVMMIYDGMTQESVADDYLAVTREYQFDLCILNIKDQHQNAVMKDIVRMLEAITADGGVQGRQGNYQILDVDNINELPMAVARIMTRQFQRVLTRTQQVIHIFNVFCCVAPILQFSIYTCHTDDRDMASMTSTPWHIVCNAYTGQCLPMSCVHYHGGVVQHRFCQTQAFCQAPSLVNPCLSTSNACCSALCNLTLLLSITRAPFRGAKCFPALLELFIAMLHITVALL